MTTTARGTVTPSPSSSSAAAERAELHRLADLIADDQLARVLRYINRSIPLDLDRVFANAPLDDEPLTDDDIAAIQEGERAAAAGRLIPHDQVKRELGL